MPKCACPHCDNSADVPENYIGKVVKCGRCKQSFQAEIDFMGEILEEDVEAPAPVEVKISEAPKPRRRPYIEAPNRKSIEVAATMHVWAGWLFIVVGVPCLIIPPVGFSLIVAGAFGVATGSFLRMAANIEQLLVVIANKD
jgi:hypothetical protein